MHQIEVRQFRRRSVKLSEAHAENQLYECVAKTQTVINVTQQTCSVLNKYTLVVSNQAPAMEERHKTEKHT